MILSPRVEKVSIEKALMSPLFYIDQILRDLAPLDRKKLLAELRKCIPYVSDRTLLEITIPIGTVEETPKCKPSTLKIPRLVTITTKKTVWIVHLHIVCTRDDLKSYNPVPDDSKTIKTLELAKENLAMLWCMKESCFYTTVVSLERKEELVSELVRLFSYHILDALTIVKTMCLCSQEAELQALVAKITIEGSTILALRPTTSKSIAMRRIYDKKRIAVLSMFSLKPQKLQGTNLASFLPIKWCIHALYVLEAVQGKRDEIPVVEILKTTEIAVERYSTQQATSLLNGKELLFCNFVCTRPKKRL